MSAVPVGEWNVAKVAGSRTDRLRWKRELGTPRERRYVRVAGVAPDVEIKPFINSLDTLLRGVAERVFYVKSGEEFVRPPRPKPGHFDRTLQGVVGQLETLLPSTAPCSHQHFVDAYSGRKRQSYQKALDDLRAGRNSLESDAMLRVFVKYEKTDWTNKLDPVPRIISPRDPRFNIRLGRYLKPLEKKIFRSIKKLFGHETVIKGFNAVRSAAILREKWDMFHDPVAVGLDAMRFDQHVGIDALKCEHRVYLKCFRQRKHRVRLAKILAKQLVNRCYGRTEDGVVEYSIEGTRMSGDMNTSLGNCLLMCLLIKAFADEKSVRISLANNGDDCQIFMERCELEHFMDGLNDWFLGMGFNMKVEDPVFEFDQVEFCQTNPVFDGDIWIMCRNPHNAIVKDSVMLKSWDSPGLFRGWLDAVGTGGLALAGGLPIFQELYALYVRSGERRVVSQDLIPWNLRCMKEGLNRGYGSVSPEARASFYWAFNVTPDEQECLEQYYARLGIVSAPGLYSPRSVFR
nr:RNA polymerase [Flumine tombus-like virus 9]